MTGAPVLAPPEPADGELLRHATPVLVLRAPDPGPPQLRGVGHVGDVGVHVRRVRPGP